MFNNYIPSHETKIDVEVIEWVQEIIYNVYLVSWSSTFYVTNFISLSLSLSLSLSRPLWILHIKRRGFTAFGFYDDPKDKSSRLWFRQKVQVNLLIP